MKDTITFFTQSKTKCEQAVHPIANEAAERGFNVEYSDNLFRETDIGVFSSKNMPHHPGANTDISVIIFHGVDSAYDSGPIRWNWSRFDVGLLPGKATAEIWKSYSKHPAARPKMGVFPVGWPKSDPVFSMDFENKCKEYKSDVGLTRNRTILYAPTYERNGNMRRFVENAKHNSNNLLIKHGDYDEGQRMNSSSLKKLYTEYSEENLVTVLDKKDNIFLPLMISDIIVSDSDSVLLEALLTDTLPVTVEDWSDDSDELRGNNDTIPELVTRISEDELRDTVTMSEKMLQNKLAKLRTERDYHFANLGYSSEVIIDLFESIRKGKKLPVSPVLSANTTRYSRYKNRIKNLSYFLMSLIMSKFTHKQQQWLLDKSRLR